MGHLVLFMVASFAVGLLLLMATGWTLGGWALTLAAVAPGVWLYWFVRFTCTPAEACGSPGDGFLLLFWGPIIAGWALAALPAWYWLLLRRATRTTVGPIR